MASNRTLVDTLAQVLGLPVARSHQTQVSGCGAAAAAAVAAGRCGSLEEAVTEARPKGEVFEPSPSSTAEYAEHYQRWLELAQSLAGSQ